MKRFQTLSTIILFGLLLSACRGADQPVATGKLKIVATTSIVGDVIANVGGEHIELAILLPVGTDPHSFDPTPQEVAKIAEADVVFANGAGLESFLDPILESAGAGEKVIHLSDDLPFLAFTQTHEEDDDDHDHAGYDPHTWTDPQNVIAWTKTTAEALAIADPQNAAAYQANADAYTRELQTLDAWIREQVDQIPAENRKIVTDHRNFGYFAAAYGFEQIGAVIPGYSTLAEPTAQEIAAMEDAIRNLGVRAIFVGNTVNPNLSERVAMDTGTQVVFVYTGSLSDLGGEAPTYLDYMRYNTNAFVDALK